MKTSTLIILIVLLVVIIGGFWYITHPMQPALVPTVGNPQATSQTYVPAPASITTTAPAPAQQVAISNFAFSPSSLTVKVGTMVTWTNNDAMTHTVTGDTAGNLTSGNIAQGANYSYTFNTVGTFPYHCAIHPNMHGSVTVTN